MPSDLRTHQAKKEYHWAGLQNLSGNAYVLAGLLLAAVMTRRAASAPRA
jgi:hypothetical protein